MTEAKRVWRGERSAAAKMINAGIRGSESFHAVPGGRPPPFGRAAGQLPLRLRGAVAKRPAQNAFGRMLARSHWEREGKLKTPQFLSRTAAQHFVGARSEAARPRQSGLAEVRAALPCRRAAVNRAARNSKFFHAVPGGRPSAQAGRRGNSHRPCRPVTAKCCALKRAVGAVPPPVGAGRKISSSTFSVPYCGYCALSARQFAPALPAGRKTPRPPTAPASLPRAYCAAPYARFHKKTKPQNSACKAASAALSGLAFHQGVLRPSALHLPLCSGFAVLRSFCKTFVFLLHRAFLYGDKRGAPCVLHPVLEGEPAHHTSTFGRSWSPSALNIRKCAGSEVK